MLMDSQQSTLNSHGDSSISLDAMWYVVPQDKYLVQEIGHRLEAT